jgi:hypothetical protein
MKGSKHLKDLGVDRKVKHIRIFSVHSMKAYKEKRGIAQFIPNLSVR